MKKKYIWNKTRDITMDYMSTLVRLGFRHAWPSMHNPSEWGEAYTGQDGKRKSLWSVSRRYPRPTL